MNGRESTPLEPVSPALDAFICPYCEQPVPAALAAGGLYAVCPNCGEEFAVPIVDDSEEVADDAPEPDEHLDASRVRELARERKAIIRLRSWCIIGLGVCVATIGELIHKAVLAVRHEGSFTRRATMFVLFAISAAMAGLFLARRAATITHELAKPVLPDPDTPPDFSTLSDGSQHWKHLDQM